MMVVIKEPQMSTPTSGVWSLHLTSGQEAMINECIVSVFDPIGQKKALFSVSLSELKEKVNELEDRG